jgi:hypothetical protein
MRPTRTPAALVLLALLVPGARADDYPAVTLRSRALEVRVYLPDPEAGYYRGPRFDWSGVVAQVRHRGHTFFGEWKSAHDPRGTDDIVGPVGEFGMDAPLGYDEAKPGEGVLKIGVGVLEKVEEDEYRFFHPYKVLRPGPWTVTRGDDWIEFAQAIDGPRGWGYRYAKRIHLHPAEPKLSVSFLLKNTGSKTIDTTHYAHNFFQIDGAPAGPAYRLTFPFAPRAEDLHGPIAVDGRTLGFTAEVPEGSDAATELVGFGGAEDHRVVVANTESGADVTATGDRPPARIHVWCSRRAVCPEPFIAIKLEPGEQMIWRNDYIFHVGE